jgi:ADP-ribose pyrophosphatase
MIETRDALCDREEIQAVSGPTITTLSSREVYRNKWLRIREDRILRSSGKSGIYGVVEKNPGAIILPIDRGRVCLVEQFRYTIGERVLELPQGCWDTDSVSPETLARGELREETGLIASEMIHLGTLWLAYGFTRQPLHVFLATGLNFAGRNPDEEEQDMTVRSVCIPEFEEMMLDGTIRDSCTLSAWGLYQLWSTNERKRPRARMS